MDVEDNIYHTLICTEENWGMSLSLLESLRTHIKEKLIAQRLRIGFSCWSDFIAAHHHQKGHFLSRVPPALLHWQSTAMTTKEEPAHWRRRGGQGAWLKVGRLILPCGNRWALWLVNCRISRTSLGYAEAYPRQVDRFLNQPGKAVRS